MMAIRELKVCLLGDTGVGKSSIVCRFVQDQPYHRGVFYDQNCALWK